jgi:hypothetical protein
MCEEASLVVVVRKKPYNPYNPYKAQKTVGQFLTIGGVFLTKPNSLTEGGCPHGFLTMGAPN